MKIYFIGERLTMCIVESPRVSIGRQKVFCLGLPHSGKKWKKAGRWQEVEEEKKSPNVLSQNCHPATQLSSLSATTPAELCTIIIALELLGRKHCILRLWFRNGQYWRIQHTGYINQTCRKVQRMVDGFFHEVGSCPSIDDLFGGFPLAREKPFVITEHFLYSNPGLVLPSPSFCGLSLI